MSHKNRILSAGLTAAAALLGHMSGPALADEAAAGNTAALEEIIVSAQRRSENLQTVPVAATVVTAERALLRGISTTTDLVAIVPSLQINPRAGSGTPFLRGIGSSNGAIGNEPSVATYIDDVYISASQAAIFSFNNIESVEVLKGPQGTLFGRNATGGVIHVKTKDPTADPTLRAQLSYGNYDTYEGALYASGAVADNVAANFALYGRKQNDGWGRNLTTGSETFTGYDVGARSKFLWDAGEDTKVTVSGDYFKFRSDVGAIPRVFPGSVGVGGTLPVGEYDTVSDSDPRIVYEQFGTSLKIDHDFHDLRLVSITAYRKIMGDQEHLDLDGGPSAIVDVNVNQGETAFTQELQLHSPTEARFRWIAGLFYYDGSAKLDPTQLRGASNLNIYGRQKVESWAAFADASYDLVESTTLTLGLRYTEDKRSVSGYFALPDDTPLAAPTSQETKADKLTYRAVLTHNFSDELMAYASYNRGFKSGAFSLSSFAAPAVRPEVLDAFEIGFKSEAFDRRLRFNASAFYYDYTDIQVQQVIGGTVSSVNAGKAKIKGFDIDMAAMPVERLTLNLGLSYLDGEYKSFENGPAFIPNPATCSPVPGPLPGPRTGGNLQCVADFSGNDTVRTPKWVISAGLDYVQPTSFGDIDFTVGYYYNDGYYWEPSNRLRQDSYHLVNASVRWTAPSETYAVRLWAKNIFDEYYQAFAGETAALDIESGAQPRTYGLTFSLNL